jgi:hypothetical protein
MLDSPTALDGNAIGGMLMEVFGHEMTTVTGVCAACGEHRMLAESLTFARPSAAVVRCRTCSSVLMVLVTVRGTTCVDLRGLAALS